MRYGFGLAPLPSALARGMAYELATFGMRGARLGTAAALTDADLAAGAQSAAGLERVIAYAQAAASDRSDPNGPAWAAFAADPDLQHALASFRNAERQGRQLSAGSRTFIEGRLNEMRRYVARQQVAIVQQEASAQADPNRRAQTARGYEDRIQALRVAIADFRSSVGAPTSFVGALWSSDPEELQTEYRRIHDDIVTDAALTQGDRDRLLGVLRGTSSELEGAAVAVLREGSEASLSIDWLEEWRQRLLSLGTLKAVAIGAGVLGALYAAFRVYRAVKRNPHTHRITESGLLVGLPWRRGFKPKGDLHLQYTGRVTGLPAAELRPGDETVWNSGYTAEVVRVDEISPSYVNVHLESSRGEIFVKRMKKSRIVALSAAHPRERNPLLLVNPDADIPRPEKGAAGWKVKRRAEEALSLILKTEIPGDPYEKRLERDPLTKRWHIAMIPGPGVSWDHFRPRLMLTRWIQERKRKATRDAERRARGSRENPLMLVNPRRRRRRNHWAVPLATIGPAAFAAGYYARGMRRNAIRSRGPSRVFKMGREWWVRDFGATSIVPTSFKTKRSAEDYAARNEAAVRERGVTSADEARVVEELGRRKRVGRRARLSSVIAAFNREPPGGWGEADVVRRNPSGDLADAKPLRAVPRAVRASKAFAQAVAAYRERYGVEPDCAIPVDAPRGAARVLSAIGPIAELRYVSRDNVAEAAPSEWYHEAGDRGDEVTRSRAAWYASDPTQGDRVLFVEPRGSRMRMGPRGIEG